MAISPDARLSRRTLVHGIGAGVAGAALTGIAAPRATRGHAQDASTLSFALSVDDLPRVQPLLDEYTAQTGIAIQAFTSPNLYIELNVSLTLGNCAYDLVSMDDPWMALFAGEEFLTDLGALAKAEGLNLDEADFVPRFLALGKSNGGAVSRAVPWIGNVQVFAWRGDVLDTLGIARPQTWDEVVSVAGAVRDANIDPGLYGVGVRGQAGNSAATTFLPILRGHGADIFDDAWEPQLTTPEAVAAMETLLDLARLAPPDVATVDHETLGKLLYTGQIAQAADIWPNQILQAYNPTLSAVLGKVEIGAQPAQPGANPAAMTGNWLLGIPAGCTGNARQALEFILWLTAPDQQRRLMLDRGLPPTRVSVFEDPEMVAALPFLPGLLAAAHDAVPRPRTLHYPAVEEILGTEVARAIKGEITAAEAMTRANDGIRALMIREGVLPGS